MWILVAIIVIALVAAVAFSVVRRPRDGIRAAGRPRRSPLRRRGLGASRRDPMAAAVAEHARALDPHDVVVAEQRLQAQARQVAAGLRADAHVSETQRGTAGPARADSGLPGDR
jgi:hypothetical protein